MQTSRTRITRIQQIKGSRRVLLVLVACAFLGGVLGQMPGINTFIRNLTVSAQGKDQSCVSSRTIQLARAVLEQAITNDKLLSTPQSAKARLGAQEEYHRMVRPCMARLKTRLQELNSFGELNQTGQERTEVLALRKSLQSLKVEEQGKTSAKAATADLNMPDGAVLAGRAALVTNSAMISGSNVGAPEWHRPFADGSCCSGLGPVRYNVVPLKVDTSGSYDFSSVADGGWDNYALLYQNSFDPLNQSANFIAGDDDGNGGIGTTDFTVNLMAGTCYIMVMTAFENGDEGSWTLTVTGPGVINLGSCGPSINPASLPDGSVGTAYNQALSVSGGTGMSTFSLNSGALPTGLALSSTGVISGTPNTAGAATFEVKAVDEALEEAFKIYTINIGCPGAISLVTTSLPNGAVGVAYNQNIVSMPAGTFAVTTNILPPGLSLNSATGALTGTPTAPGTYAFVITASLNGCPATAARSYSIVVSGSCPTISVNPTSLPVGTQGTMYSQTISATGGVAPYTFSLASGALPGGLTLHAASGLLSGTPAATGTFVFTVRATGQGGCSGQRVYVLTINCGTVTIDTTLPNPVKGVAYSQTLAASPLGTYTFNVLIGSLPPGLTLSSAGVLSGVTNVNGTHTFTVRARTASGCQGTRTYTLTVVNP